MLDFLKQNALWLLLALPLTTSLVSLVLLCVDKLRAIRKHGRRIPEKTLLALSVAFGSFGTLLGMLLFRHKINAKRHPAFAWGVPLLAIAQGIVLLALLMQAG